jgi:hypothetical protein
MVVSATMLLACIGLAIDAGYLQLVKSRMQTAADAAAIGGAQEFRMNGAARVRDAARTDAAANGFTDGVNATTVTVHNPPASGFYAADPMAVEVVISKAAPTFFMGIVGVASTGVRARSVARPNPSASCVYALDAAASGAFSASGSVAVQMSCGLMVNSGDSSAAVASGGAQVTAAAISIAGNYSTSGGGALTPAPSAHSAPENDPLSYIAAPAVGGCDYTNYKLSGGKVAELLPGVYCGGIAVSGGATVTLRAGTYVLLGGGLSLTGGSGLSGTGVTFYNTFDASHGYDGIGLSGGTAIALSAPTTGPLAGVLFFQDRRVTNGASSSLTGGATSVFNGALYFPTTALSYSGGAASTYTIVVAKTISVTGNAKLSSDYSSLPAGTPAKSGAALSE